MQTKQLQAYHRLFGLIGYPLSHSFSKKYFREKFAREGITDSFYELFPLENIELFPTLVASLPNLRGINVTIPYKQQVIPYLYALDESAEGVGAVNVIRVEAGRLTGYNSDVYGFQTSLQHFLAEEQAVPNGALVLGTGGAARATTFVLHKMGLPFRLVSRRASEEALAYEDIDRDILQAFPLIINTTPLGMSPGQHTCPSIPYHLLGPAHLLFDLVYNPAETLFLQRGKQQGCPTRNGLEMLYLQAEKAWEIWQ